MPTFVYPLGFWVGLCIVVWVLFRFMHVKPGMYEGMTTDASSNTSHATSSNGIAGNADAYGAAIKSTTIQFQDRLLISKYRTSYETVILNMDDLMNNLMLNTVLTLNPSSPQSSVDSLAKLQQAKMALNSVMKYVDSQ